MASDGPNTTMAAIVKMTDFFMNSKLPWNITVLQINFVCYIDPSAPTDTLGSPLRGGLGVIRSWCPRRYRSPFLGLLEETGGR